MNKIKRIKEYKNRIELLKVYDDIKERISFKCYIDQRKVFECYNQSLAEDLFQCYIEKLRRVEPKLEDKRDTILKLVDTSIELTRQIEVEEDEINYDEVVGIYNELLKIKELL